LKSEKKLKREKKRYRIHPAIAITAIIALAIIAISAKLTFEESTAILIQQAIIALIMLIVGIKVRVKLPVT